MDFKEATDKLFEPVTHNQLADALGCSVASIRQARLDPSAQAHRQPPPDWKKVVISLAEKRERHYRQLVQKLKG